MKMALIARRKPFKSVEVGLLMKILGVHWPEQVSSYIRGYIDTDAVPVAFGDGHGVGNPGERGPGGPVGGVELCGRLT